MVYITGDTHGDFERLDSLRLKKGDTLIICGDFGFIWDGSAREEKILKQLGKKKFNICFIDGTHENFELLDEYEVGVFCGGKARNISGNLYHLMRGQIYCIEGNTFFTMGGGESPDIDMLFDNGAWSRREFPSTQELTEGAENLDKVNGKVDYIITHEPPSKIKSFMKLKTERNQGRSSCTGKHHSYDEQHGRSDSGHRSGSYSRNSKDGPQSPDGRKDTSFHRRSTYSQRGN